MTAHTFPATFPASGAIFVIARSTPARTRISGSGWKVQMGEGCGTVPSVRSCMNLKLQITLMNFPYLHVLNLYACAIEKKN